MHYYLNGLHFYSFSTFAQKSLQTLWILNHLNSKVDYNNQYFFHVKSRFTSKLRAKPASYNWCCSVILLDVDKNCIFLQQWQPKSFLLQLNPVLNILVAKQYTFKNLFYHNFLNLIFFLSFEINISAYLKCSL